jgi:hypothetical protein
VVHEHGPRQKVRTLADTHARTLRTHLRLPQSHSGSISANELANVAIGGVPIGNANALASLNLTPNALISAMWSGEGRL